MGPIAWIRKRLADAKAEPFGNANIRCPICGEYVVGADPTMRVPVNPRIPSYPGRANLIARCATHGHYPWNDPEHAPAGWAIRQGRPRPPGASANELP